MLDARLSALGVSTLYRLTRPQALNPDQLLRALEVTMDVVPGGAVN